VKAGLLHGPLLAPGDLNGAIPPGECVETNFTTGQRNIFRQRLAQKRTDLSRQRHQDQRALQRPRPLGRLSTYESPSFDIPHRRL